MRCSPTSGLPTMVGADVFAGRCAGVIGAVSFELTAAAVPAAFVAETSDSIV